MNKKEFKHLLAVPTTTYNEECMVQYLRDYLAGRISVKVAVDAHNNVYVLKGGNGKPLPCVAAHIDSVQPLRMVRIVEHGGFLTARNLSGKQVGFGADDKTGIWVCLELLERFEHIALMLFAAEEYGCQGAYHADPSFFKSIGCIIEFDCPSRGMVSYRAGGVRLFDNQGEFIQRALPALRKHGSIHWQDHPFTDVMAVRRRFPISALNLSSGYYNWHMPTELVKLSDVEAAIEQGEDLIRALGCEYYPCRQDLCEDMPAIKVGPLDVPKP